MENLLATSNESRSLKKWNELSLRFGGRITPDDVVNFETDFHCLRCDLPHLTEGECLRHLLSKLPTQLANYVHEEEARLHLSQPQVLVKMPQDYLDQNAFAKVMEGFLGVKLHKVHKTPDKRGEYIFTLSDRNDVRKALARDGVAVRGSPDPLEIKEHRRELTIPEIFEFLHYKLQNRERIDNFHRNNGGDRGDRYRSPNRDRSVRIANSASGGDRTERDRDANARSQSPPSQRPQTPGTSPSTPNSSRPGTPASSRASTPPTRPRPTGRGAGGASARGNGAPRAQNVPQQQSGSSQGNPSAPQFSLGKGGGGPLSLLLRMCPTAQFEEILLTPGRILKRHKGFCIKVHHK